ncbi:MAG: sugar kinase [Actinomycetales bacterium]|nr:sugar kinase [Actinomycetales bacterium]
MTSFIVLGDVMTDVSAVIDGPIQHGSDTPARIRLHAGGSAANTARWLAHLGQHACLVGAIGDDALGQAACAELQRDGVIPALAIRAGAATGTCIVIVDPSGERSMLPDAGANALLTPADLPADRFHAGAHLHVSGYSLLRRATRGAALAALELARQRGLTTSLDAASAAPIALEPTAYCQAYPLLDLMLANADEAYALTGDREPMGAAHALSALVSTVVVKAGAQGAVAVRAGEAIAVPSPGVAVVDSTGAGDAFAAGLLPSWASGAHLEQALQRGVEVAAAAVGRVGAGPPPA